VDLKPKLNIFKDHAQRKGLKTKMPLSNVNARLQLPFRPVNIIPVEYKKVKLNLTAMAVCHTSFNAMDHICEIVSSEGRDPSLRKYNFAEPRNTDNFPLYMRRNFLICDVARGILH
jgi:hypothetical protein